MTSYLIFRTDRIGDFLLSAILIKSIKDKDKDSHVTVVSSKKNYEYIKNYKLVFVHPPREDNKPSLSEQAISTEKFVKRNMENNLKDKVRRNNNLVVEIQGSVTFTSK